MKTKTCHFPPNKLRSLRTLRKRINLCGFSLVEVTLAIGIVSFALVSVVGLMPVGMGVFSTTVKNTNSKRIADRMMAEIRDTPWSTLKDYAGGDGNVNWGFYQTTFDINGDQKTGANAVFKSRVDVSSVQGEAWRYPLALPGTSGYVEQNLRHITIQVAYVPEGLKPGDTDAGGIWVFGTTSAVSKRGDVRTYQFLLGKNGI